MTASVVSDTIWGSMGGDIDIKSYLSLIPLGLEWKAEEWVHGYTKSKKGGSDRPGPAFNLN